MDKQDQRQDNEAWYTNPMVWMVILLPATVVVASIITIIIAAKTEDGLVVDNYYKKGIEINQDLADDRTAKEMGLSAFVDINTRSGEITVSLSAKQKFKRPPSIKFNLIHRTRSGLDQETTLNRVEGSEDYFGYLRPPVIEGRWTVQVKSDLGWRVRQNLTTKSAEHIILNITS